MARSQLEYVDSRTASWALQAYSGVQQRLESSAAGDVGYGVAKALSNEPRSRPRNRYLHYRN